jgi:hypothetical protein
MGVNEGSIRPLNPHQLHLLAVCPGSRRQQMLQSASVACVWSENPEFKREVYYEKRFFPF